MIRWTPIEEKLPPIGKLVYVHLLKRGSTEKQEKNFDIKVLMMIDSKDLNCGYHKKKCAEGPYLFVVKRSPWQTISTPHKSVILMDRVTHWTEYTT